MIKRLSIDPFLLKLFATVALASLLPAQGWGVALFQHSTQIAIALLFFLHGARLSREAIWGGLSHWRLHLLILSVTFLLFPILGSGVAAVLRPWLTDNLYLGILFLACLPSTVQSAVALTAMARGNVPVSICSASASTLLGVFITPLLVGVMLAGATSAQATVSLEAVGKDYVAAVFPLRLRAFAAPVDRCLGDETSEITEGSGSGIDTAGGIYGFFGRSRGRTLVLYPSERLGPDYFGQRCFTDPGTIAGLESGALAGLFV